jgi:hypothetical protein
MGGMASRGPPSTAPEPVDAPPPTLKEGLTFKDAVLEPAEPASSSRGSPRGSSPRRKAATKAAAGGGGGATELTAQGAAKKQGAQAEGAPSVTQAVAQTTEAVARTTVAATGLWRPFRFLARSSDKTVSKFTSSQRFLNAVRHSQRAPAARARCMCLAAHAHTQRRARYDSAPNVSSWLRCARAGRGHVHGVRHGWQRRVHARRAAPLAPRASADASACASAR